MTLNFYSEYEQEQFQLLVCHWQGWIRQGKNSIFALLLEIKIMNLTLGVASRVQEDDADICHEGNVQGKDHSKAISDISDE